MLAQLAPGTTVCVGLSGGVDSVVLLHLLATHQALAQPDPRFNLSAVHVHHGLSANADQWAQFAVDYAASLGVDCAVERVTLRQRRDLGVEGAARNARYAAFQRQAAQIIAVAHHQDDQAETVLLNLLRGSGVAGLAAMPELRPLGNASLWRPLLEAPRSSLLLYAVQHDLRWVEDESNQYTDYDRNFLRHKVMPVLYQAFPTSDAALARTARHMAQASQLLAALAAEDLTRCLQQDAFDLSTDLPELRLKHALRHWLANHAMVLDTRAFDELWRVMTTSEGDTQPRLVWRQQAVRRYRSCLWITAAQLAAGPLQTLPWQGEGAQSIPYWQGTLTWQIAEAGQGIALEHLQAGWQARPWQGSATLRLRAHGPSQQLKTLSQSRGIAPWLRTCTPLIYIGDQLAAFPGLGIDHRFLAPADERGWLPVWQLPAHQAK